MSQACALLCVQIQSRNALALLLSSGVDRGGGEDRIISELPADIYTPPMACIRGFAHTTPHPSWFLNLPLKAHAFHGSAALFDVATKLTHTCHNPMVEYTSGPSRGVGMFVATRNIPTPGTMLTTSYLGTVLSVSVLFWSFLFCSRLPLAIPLSLLLFSATIQMSWRATQGGHCARHMLTCGILTTLLHCF